MKKVLALALAVAMVLSMASVIFAADKKIYAIDSVDVSGYQTVVTKEIYLGGKNTSGRPTYGSTIYYPLWGPTYIKGADGPDDEIDYGQVEKYDAVKGVKITSEWDLGSEWVSSTSLVKKKSSEFGKYYYYLAISFKSAPTKAESSDVAGEIMLKKTSGDNKINRNNDGGGDKAGETPKYSLNLELRYRENNTEGNLSMTIDENSRTFEFDTGKIDKLNAAKDPIPPNLYNEDEETEFEFSKWEGATFLVNTYGQGKIVLKAHTDYNADIGAMYPDANLDFYNGNGAGFNKTGTMFIPCEEGSYIYELKNGVLVAIPSAEYDDYEEGFYFRTRILGTYVVSDTELDLAAAPSVSTPGDGGISVVEPGDAPTIPVNPGTGAAA